MTFPAPPGYRFAYDADGTVVVINGVAATGAQLLALNNEADDVAVSGTDTVIAFGFPQSARALTAAYLAVSAGVTSVDWESSGDSTNGVDGTWSTLSYTGALAFDESVVPGYRNNWNGTVAHEDKWFRFTIHGTADVKAFHLYGNLASSFTGPDALWMSGGTSDMPVATAQRGGITLFTSGPTPVVKNLSAIAAAGVALTIEALTDAPTRSLPAQFYVDTHSVSTAFKASSVPVNVPAGSNTTFGYLAVLAPDADPGPWAVRIRADKAGFLPGFLYVYLDDVTSDPPVNPMIINVAPHTGAVAGVTAVTIKAIGVGAALADRDSLVSLFSYATGSLVRTLPDPDDITWTVIPPSANAYTGAREVSPAVCDPQHVEIHFTLPTDAAGMGASTPEIDLTGGTYSSGVTDHPFYAPELFFGEEIVITNTVFVNAPSASTSTSAIGEIRSRQDPEFITVDLTEMGFWPSELLPVAAYPASSLPQRSNIITKDPYVVIDGVPQIPPALGSLSKSVAYARSWSPTMNLGAALALGLMGASERWLPDPADVVGTTWRPHFGGPHYLWFDPVAPTPPILDPDYEYYARGEALKTVQAMIFDGTSWAQFGGPASQAGFAWVIVAVLHHPPNRSYYDIFSSPATATDPDRATDTTLRYDNGRVISFGRSKLSSTVLHPPTYKGRLRPVIIAWSEGNKGGRLMVVDALGRHYQEYAHTNVSYDLRMWFGMNGAVEDPLYAAEMDVLDLVYFDASKPFSQLSPIVTKLDGVYGVTGR